MKQPHADPDARVKALVEWVKRVTVDEVLRESAPTKGPPKN